MVKIRYLSKKKKKIQTNLFKRPPLQDDNSSKTPNAESAQADSYTIVTA